MKSTKYTYWILLVLLLILFQGNKLLSQWEKVTLPSQFSSTYFLDVYFHEDDPDYGWVCGYDGVVMRTTDRGKTWSGVSIPGARQLESVNFPTKDVGYTSGLGDLGNGLIYKSTDGGQSWRNVTPRMFNDGLWGNFFATRDIGLVIGGGCSSSQQFFRTTDGGENWSLYETNEPNSGMCDLFLNSPDGLGYASSSGRVWVTYNGGVTWNIFAVSGSNDWQEEITLRGNTFVLPYSDGCTGSFSGGGIRSSNDLGRRWRQFDANVPMFGAFLQDSLKGWAVGHEAKVFYTSDGGKNWELQNCGLGGNDMDDIWFINDTTGFVVGAGIYKFKLLESLKPAIIADRNILACRDDSISLSTDKVYKSYRWSTGETTRSIVVRRPGVYTVVIKESECEIGVSESFVVTNVSPPDITLQTDRPLPVCEGDSAIIFVMEDFKSYRWSTGETTKSIQIKKGGTYSVVVTDTNDCEWAEEFQADFYPNPKPIVTVAGRTDFCVGDTTWLRLDQDYAEIYWHRIDMSIILAQGVKEYPVTESGTYMVRVVTKDGCLNWSDPLEIIVRAETNQIQFNFETENKMDFDSVKLREIYCRDLTLYCVGSSPAVINNLSLFRNTSFSVTQSQFPITINPGESKTIQVCFAPYKTGTLKDTIFINDICDNHYIYLEGAGVEIIYDATTRCELPIKLSYKGKWVYEFYSFEPFPNPSNEIVTLPFELWRTRDYSAEVSAQLLNLYGQVLMNSRAIITESSAAEEKLFEKGHIKFDLSGIENGIYICLIETGGSLQQYKIMITK